MRHFIIACNGSFMKALKVILMAASFVAMVSGEIFPKLYLWVCGTPALIFSFEVIHEFGHIIACKIVKTKIYVVEVFGFVFYKKFEIKPNISLFGRVVFNKTKKEKFVFGLGILFSIIITIINTLLFLLNASNIVYFVDTWLCMLVLLIPFRSSDIRKIFERS